LKKNLPSTINFKEKVSQEIKICPVMAQRGPWETTSKRINNLHQRGTLPIPQKVEEEKTLRIR